MLYLSVTCREISRLANDKTIRITSHRKAIKAMIKVFDNIYTQQTLSGFYGDFSKPRNNS